MALMKVRLEMESRSHRYHWNRPGPRNGHAFIK